LLILRKNNKINYLSIFGSIIAEIFEKTN